MSPLNARCGVDIEPLERVRKLYGKGAMPMGLFTAAEQQSIKSYLSAAYAFTAKESVLKALGAGWFNTELDAHDIELDFDIRGIPRLVNFSARVQQTHGTGQTATLKFYWLGGDLLATFTVLDGAAEQLAISIMVYCRSSCQLFNLSNGAIVPAHMMFREQQSGDTRALGHKTVQFAVQALCHSTLALPELGSIHYNAWGAPYWVNSAALEQSGFRVADISITHDKNYICGIVIGKTARGLN